MAELTPRMKELVQPYLAGIEPYDPNFTPTRINLSANENTYPVPAGVREAVDAALAATPLNRYPDPMSCDLRDELAAYVEGDGPLLAICGGYQILGRQWLWGDELVPGLGLIDMETRRPGTSADRLIDNMVLESPLAAHPVVGYENHAGRTHLGEGVTPLGRVLYGHGNDGITGYEGVLYKNVVGTYVHGPLLPKNPGVADYLIARAMERKYGTAELEPLDDTEELAANEVMYHRLMAGEVQES